MRPEAAGIADLAARAGLGRIHILAWRDLDDPEAGGSELHVDQVARRWAEAGIEVTIRTSAAVGAPETARRGGYRVVRRAGRYAVFPLAALAEISGRHGPRDGLVEIWNGMPFFSPVWARGSRVIWLHHAHTDMWPLVMGRRPAALGMRLERDLAPRLYRGAAVVTLSESSRRCLIDSFGLRPDRIRVVPPGVEERFRPGGPESEQPMLVAVARLMPPKGLDRVIRIAARLRQHRDLQCLRLVIAGEGYQRGELERLVDGLGAGEWCELAGRVDDDALVGLYRRAWALVSCSVSEGWGLTLTEAAACGTPAVASRIPGHVDAVADGVTGHLASGDDEFLVALERVLTDPGHRRRLGQAARERAAGYSWDRTARDTLAVLAEESHRRRRR